MKKVVLGIFAAIICVAISLNIFCLIDSKKNNEIGIAESFQGEVTYYDRVVNDENNYLLKLKQDDTEISFCVLPKTSITGKTIISVGDKVRIKSKREDNNSTYREVIEAKIL